MQEGIDFVITWVDGEDPKWLEEKKKYDNTIDYFNDVRIVRYRDLGILRYWFRGVENNAPWVNKIFFVTWGHIPDWLNTENQKLVIAKHSDFIPEKYLPTFNSCAIEMNLHRIKGLSECFVYFNDDMYLLNKTRKEDFFKKGKPCDAAILSIIMPCGKDMFEHRLVNNSIVLNRHYSQRKTIMRHPFQWINIRYNTKQIQSIPLLFKKRFSTLRNSHLPASLQKSTFEYLWKNEREVMENTSSQRFRSITCVNPWLIQAFQIASGNFAPRNPRIGKYYENSDDMSEIIHVIKKSKKKMVCINDDITVSDIEKVKMELEKAFIERFPQKSSFEK